MHVFSLLSGSARQCFGSPMPVRRSSAHSQLHWLASQDCHQYQIEQNEANGWTGSNHNLCIPSPGQNFFLLFDSLRSSERKRIKRIRHQPIFRVLFSGFVLRFSTGKLCGLALLSHDTGRALSTVRSAVQLVRTACPCSLSLERLPVELGVFLEI